MGFMVTHLGIEVNPDQVKAINSLQPPRNPKEVQRLTGMMAALNRFISWSLLPSADYTGKIAKWGTSLGAFDIKYIPRISVKGQVLADLVAEFAEPSLEEHMKRSDIDEKLVGMISLKESLLWKVYVDGAANQRGSEVGLVIISPDKIVIEKSLRMGFSAMNNEAEYEALLIGITMVQKMGGKNAGIFKSGWNTHADSLATLAMSSAQSLPWVILVEDLYKPTKINVDVVRVHHIKVGPSWMDPVVLYLKENILPEEKSEADKCQRFAPNIHQPGGVLNSLSSPWPFAQWSLDIVRPFPKTTGNKRFLLVGMDYFTKWVEAKPLSNIRDLDARRFVWKNIVTRFGIPHTLISDNSVQLDSKVFRRYCCDLGITNRYSTPVYPQGNGQAKVVNKGYDLNVKLRPLAPGDLVLTKVLGTAKNLAWGKLGPNWKRPYRITSVVRIGVYYLEDLDEKVVPHP
ncbi:uncharacterized protein LOC142606566 [Castanea sativa]|uniref:uncharacterized protein LOC142606566 n=1 Tax=Castanea sativa TaxID=21020 RepID=UPI003F649D82